ncbi:MAG: sulfite exporter TauE/SafE family protein [Alphaproteobacteria bacterium]|nr:sulfite exporter TauE/SafE family protein [Alphaproteobacteria bacterium]MBL6954041.1 sulfite exporter TauE/SafE family protein [Alphaproteobacteria bacterium]
MPATPCWRDALFDPLIIGTIFGTFLIAGTVKGVIGLGLPTVSLALLTVATDLPSAMALLLVPSFITNLWQAMVGGEGRAILRRLWPFLLMATATVWLGALALTRVDLSLLSALLGGLLVAYALISLAGVRLAITLGQEVWVGPLLGIVNGVLAGMTGSFVVPGVLFLQAIGLSRDQLIQAMGILFTASTLALAVALQGNNLLNMELGTMSAVALLPAVIGMALGQRIRQRLSEQLFRRLFFVSLLILGGYIVANAVAAMAAPAVH